MHIGGQEMVVDEMQDSEAERAQGVGGQICSEAATHDSTAEDITHMHRLQLRGKETAYPTPPHPVGADRPWQ